MLYPLSSVAVFESEARAIAAAAKLQSEGIEAHVEREGLGGIPVRYGRVFGNRVLVRSADARRAREVLGLPAEEQSIEDQQE